MSDLLKKRNRNHPRDSTVSNPVLCSQKTLYVTENYSTKYHSLTDTLKYLGSISNSQILNSTSKNKELYQIKEWLFDFKIWATVFYESLEWSRVKDEVSSRDKKDEMKHCEDFLCIYKPLVPWNDLIFLLCWLYYGILRYLNIYCRILVFFSWRYKK